MHVPTQVLGPRPHRPRWPGEPLQPALVLLSQVLAHGLEPRQERADLVTGASDAAIKLLDDLDRPPQAYLEEVDVDNAAIELSDYGVELVGRLGVAELANRHLAGRGGSFPLIVLLRPGRGVPGIAISSTIEPALPSAKVVISRSPGRTDADDRTMRPPAAR